MGLLVLCAVGSCSPDQRQPPVVSGPGLFVPYEDSVVNAHHERLQAIDISRVWAGAFLIDDMHMAVSMKIAIPVASINGKGLEGQVIECNSVRWGSGTDCFPKCGTAFYYTPMNAGALQALKQGASGFDISFAAGDKKWDVRTQVPSLEFDVGTPFPSIVSAAGTHLQSLVKRLCKKSLLAASFKDALSQLPQTFGPFPRKIRDDMRMAPAEEIASRTDISIPEGFAVLIAFAFEKGWPCDVSSTNRAIRLETVEFGSVFFDEKNIARLFSGNNIEWILFESMGSSNEISDWISTRVLLSVYNDF